MFSVHHSCEYKADRFVFHKIELADKIILNIHVNSILDSTYAIEPSTREAIGFRDWDDDEVTPERSVEPKVLIGNHANMKATIVAAEVGKLVTSARNKGLILSLGTKWLGRFDEVDDGDFERLMFVLENTRKVMDEPDGPERSEGEKALSD